MIGEAWATYVANIVPPDASEARRQETKMAFYSGAAAMYEAMLRAADLDENPAALLETLDRELADYLRELFTSRGGI